MGVEDASREGVVDLLLEDRAEARHHHEVDVVALERLDHAVGVGGPVEVGPEALTLHDLGGHARPLRQLGGAAGPVDDHHENRQAGLQDRLQVAPATRRQDPDAHGPEPTSGRRARRALLSVHGEAGG